MTYRVWLVETIRAIFVWPWNDNARTKKKQQTNGDTAIWLVYRTDINAGWKKFIPENFLEVNRYFTLTSYCNTIGQSNNAFSILGFSWRENEESMFWSFHSLADKTNNEHLPKPFFKVIRESLSGTVKRATKTCILFFHIAMMHVLLPTNQTRVLLQIRSLQVAKICCRN